MIKRLLIYILCLVYGLNTSAQQTIELTGEWEYAVGDSTQYNGFVTLPGTVEQDGLLWLRKNVYVPQTWEKQRVLLYLERPLGKTTLFVNGQEVGQQSSFNTPHQYEISNYLVPGQRNKIVICVNKGIVGLMGLKAQSKRLYIEKVKITPDMMTGLAHLTVDVAGDKRNIEDYAVYGDIWQVGYENEEPVGWGFYLIDRQVSKDIILGKEVFVWDEFRPRLYRISANFGDDSQEKVFGMREFSVKDGQLHINGCPIWLRGTVDDGRWFSDTGYPPMDEETWMDIFRKYETYGLNFIRFRGYCPPEAAFAAADKIGFYLQTDRYGEEEARQIEETYGHHPSLMLLPDSVANLNTKEIGPWRAFPDTKVVREKLLDHGMTHQTELFMMASGGLQTLRYKDEIERNLCDMRNGGFVLPAFEPRGNEEEWKEFCSPVVALAHMPKYVYANNDSLVVPVEVYNAMYGEIQNTRNVYYISNDSLGVLTGGVLSAGDIPMGKGLNSGTVRFALDDITKPSKLSLAVAVAGKLKNHWDFWVYPTDSVETMDVPQDIFVADTLNAKALDVLKKGGKVLLTARGKVQQDVREALGTYIEQTHPLFRYDFPTDSWANRNWQELLDEARAMDLTVLSNDYLSPIQPIDHWETCRKLGMLVEANVLKGKLLLTTMNISDGLDHRLVARQLRKAIFAYMQSDDFKPTITLQPQIVNSLYTTK